MQYTSYVNFTVVASNIRVTYVNYTLLPYKSTMVIYLSVLFSLAAKLFLSSRTSKLDVNWTWPLRQYLPCTINAPDIVGRHDFRSLEMVDRNRHMRVSFTLSIRFHNNYFNSLSNKLCFVFLERMVFVVNTALVWWKSSHHMKVSRHLSWNHVCDL